MILDEWKTNLVFEDMRKIANELGLKEADPADIYPHLSKIDPDFFICWAFGRKKGVVLHTPTIGFAYIPPTSGFVKETVDNWQTAFESTL
jgi:hypothetical protein